MFEALQQIPFVTEGGRIMLVLYVISLTGIALILERVFALRKARATPLAWMQQVRETVSQHGVAGLGDQAVWPENDVSDVLKQVLKNAGIAGEIQAGMIEQSIARKEEQLMRGLTLLGLLAAISPLLGLLGTVSGMIETFRMIAAGGIGDPKALAGGIYKALYTTAGGLTIAIPLTVGFRLLRQRARRLADDIGSFVEDLMWLDRHGKT